MSDLSSKLREEYQALWRRNERPIGLLIRPELITKIADEYSSDNPWAVHWKLYGLSPTPDHYNDLPKGKNWKFLTVKFKPGKKNEVLASVEHN